MHSKYASLLLLVTALLFSYQAAHAQLVVESSNQGRIDVGPYGVSRDSSSNDFRLGLDPATSFLGVPYFVFEIPTLSEAIDSVTLSIYNPGDVNIGSSSFLLFDQGYDNNTPAGDMVIPWIT